jgi:hypothetical protein
MEGLLVVDGSELSVAGYPQAEVRRMVTAAIGNVGPVDGDSVSTLSQDNWPYHEEKCRTLDHDA